eukprot:2358299-Rhodomonas_salina.2
MLQTVPERTDAEWNLERVRQHAGRQRVLHPNILKLLHEFMSEGLPPTSHIMSSDHLEMRFLSMRPVIAFVTSKCACFPSDP